jgi:sec-independent protein translocase protein TatA
MFGLSVTELLVVLVIVMLVFGANRLPEIGSSLGRAISGFKKAVDEKDRNITPPAESPGLEEAGQPETVPPKAVTPEVVAPEAVAMKETKGEEAKKS